MKSDSYIKCLDIDVVDIKNLLIGSIDRGEFIMCHGKGNKNSIVFNIDTEDDILLTLNYQYSVMSHINKDIYYFNENPYQREYVMTLERKSEIIQNHTELYKPISLNSTQEGILIDVVYHAYKYIKSIQLEEDSASSLLGSYLKTAIRKNKISNI